MTVGKVPGDLQAAAGGREHSLIYELKRILDAIRCRALLGLRNGTYHPFPLYSKYRS